MVRVFTCIKIISLSIVGHMRIIEAHKIYSITLPGLTDWWLVQGVPSLSPGDG